MQRHSFQLWLLCGALALSACTFVEVRGNGNSFSETGELGISHSPAKSQPSDKLERLDLDVPDSDKVDR
jgi:hypothetical protein